MIGYFSLSVLSKELGYKFVIKLPSEKLLFTGLKDVFKFPMKSKGEKGYGDPKPETVIYGPSMSGHYGPPRPVTDPPPTYGAPKPDTIYGAPPPESYGPPPGESHGPPPPESYGPPPSDPPATYGVPDSGGGSSEYKGGGSSEQKGSGSTYSNLKKDLDGGSDSFSNGGYEKTFQSKDIQNPSQDMQHLGHNSDVFVRHGSSTGNQSHSNAEFDTQSGSSDQHYSVNSLPSKDLDVIMSPLDHQRLLGFLSIEKTFDG